MSADDVEQSARWQRLLPVLVVALAPLVLFFDATLGRVELSPGDSLLVTLPNRQLVASYLRAGEWPLWNPFMFSGIPMLAVSQMAVLHPGTWLYVALPELWATNVQVLGTYVAAGLATYAYCRAIGCSRFGAMLGGLTFTGSGFMLAHLGHVGIIQAAACLPALLWCLERQRTGGTWRFVAGGALAIALAIFAGHPQVSVMLLAAGTAYALYFTLVDPGTAGRRGFASGAALTLGGGVLLAAVQLVPMPELVAQSPRARLSFADFTSFALPLRQVPTLLLPYLYGGDLTEPYRGEFNFVEMCGYGGLIPVMLTLAAVPAATRDRNARFWLLLGATGFLLMLGAQTPLARLAYQVPIWNLFRATVRNVLFVNLAVAVLAAWSATHVLPRRPRAICVGAAVVVLAVAAGVVSTWVVWPSTSRASLITSSVLAISGALALVFATRRPSALGRTAVATLLAADLYAFGTQLAASQPPPRFLASPPDYVEWLLAEKVQPQATRVAQLYAGDTRATRADLERWRVVSLMGFEPLMLARYGEFAGQMTYFGGVADRAVVESPLFLDMLNAGYLVVKLPPATRVVAAGGFAPQPIGVQLAAGQSLTLTLPTLQRASGIDLVTYLSRSQSVEEDTVVGLVAVTGLDGRVTEIPLRAGRETAEWAWARPDVAPVMRHRQAVVWETLESEEFVGSQYLARSSLPSPTLVSSVRFENVAEGPILTIVRASLRDGPTITPLTYAHALFGDGERWEVRRVGAREVLLRNRRALPRAWLVPAVQTLSDEAILAAVREGRLPDGRPFEPRAVALVTGEAPAGLGPADPTASATVRRWSPNAVAVETSSATPAFLVLSEIDYPGWVATLDDVPVPIVRTNGLLRGVAVPAGKHRVGFAFRPWLPLAGAGVTAATMLAFLVVGIRRRTNRRPPRADRSPGSVESAP